MNPVNKAQLKEFAEAFDFEKLGEPDQFELYSIYSILNGGSGEHIDPFLAHLKGNEFGLDGIAVIIQGNIVTDSDEAVEALTGISNPQIDFYFFQSKTSSDFDYGAVSKFLDGVKWFFTGDLTNESAQIDDLMSAREVVYAQGVNRQNPGLHCFFATTGTYEGGGRLARLVENTIEGFRELSIFDEDRLRVEMLGASALQRLYRAAVTSSAVTIDFNQNIALPINPAVEEGYIGYLPASELMKIVSIADDDGEITAINKSVFFDNIRDYNPGSKINKEVSETLESGSGNDFIFRNNGVTVVAKSIRRTANKFRIEDFQVVNGCQTSNILFNNRAKLGDVNVPFRLIGTRDEDFIFSIISGTNKQNAVRPEQFWSLLPFMKNLEEYCRAEPESRRVFIERRENQYKTEAVERARIVQMQPLYKAVTATLLAQPHRAARNYKNEIGDNIDALFDESCDVRPAYATAYLHYRLEFLWRNQRVPLATKLYRFYIMDAVARKALDGKDYVALGKKERIAFSDAIIAFAESEQKLSDAVVSVSKEVEAQIDSMGIADSRERLRDSIRSESFAKAIQAKQIIP